MTRINVVPVDELCDQHVLAEHRELTRIPNALREGRYDMRGQPSQYVLGTGHVKFFYDKMLYLLNRYNALHDECYMRGFQVIHRWPNDLQLPPDMWKDYAPTPEAIALNWSRIHDRMRNFEPRYTRRKVPTHELPQAM